MHLTDPFQYAIDVISALDEAGYFEKDKLVDPAVLFRQIETAANKKVKRTGETILSEEEISECYDRAIHISVDEVIADLLQEGKLEISGITPEGELLYSSIPEDNPKPKDIELIAQCERFLSGGPNIYLN
jgi:hypothetical protein